MRFKSFYYVLFFLMLPFCVVAMEKKKEEVVEITVDDLELELGDLSKPDGVVFKDEVYNRLPESVKTLLQKRGMEEDIKSKINKFYTLDSQNYDTIGNKMKEFKRAARGQIDDESDDDQAVLEAKLALEKETSALQALILADQASEERRANKRLKCGLITTAVGGGLAFGVAVVQAVIFSITFFAASDDNSC